MGLITDVRLYQPVKNELVARRFLVAGIGAGFEGTIGIRVLGPKGKVLAQDSAQSSGGGIGIGEFSTHVRLDDPPRAGTRLTVQVFGDNPGLPDEGPSPASTCARPRSSCSRPCRDGCSTGSRAATPSPAS